MTISGIALGDMSLTAVCQGLGKLLKSFRVVECVTGIQQSSLKEVVGDECGRQAFRLVQRDEPNFKRTISKLDLILGACTDEVPDRCNWDRGKGPHVERVVQTSKQYFHGLNFIFVQ